MHVNTTGRTTRRLYGSAGRPLSCFINTRLPPGGGRQRGAAHMWVPAIAGTEPKQEQPMHIRDVMTPNPRTVTPSDTIQNAAQIMRDEDTGAVPVVDNGRAVGMVTDRDIVVRAVADGSQPSRRVSEIVTR